MMKHRIFIFEIIMTILMVSCSQKVITNSTKKTDEVQAPVDTQSIKSFDPAHNAQNSLDWNGTYEGIIPCEDCSGIKTSLTLNENNTFSVLEEYIGKKIKYDEKGAFQWDSTGGIIILKRKGGNYKYMVGEHQLFLLDGGGKVINESTKDLYILKQK